MFFPERGVSFRIVRSAAHLPASQRCGFALSFEPSAFSLEPFVYHLSSLSLLPITLCPWPLTLIT
jgi:hypothetical protein